MLLRSKRLFSRRAAFAGAGASAAVLMALSLSAPAMAQIVNGNFEAPVAGSVVTYPPPPSGFGWNVISGSIDHGHHPGQTNCQAGSATQCVDLNGGSPGTIQQAVVTTPGRKYRVSFYMSRHRQLMLGTGVPATMDALVNNNVVQSFTHSVIGGTAAFDGGWQPHYFDFIAPTASTSLAFASTTQQGPAGPQIDNVSIKEILAYDIAVKKQHQGNMYFVGVTNPGQPIPVGAKIVVVDVVPQGLTITVATNNAPWTCAPTGTIVGPDSVTCTYSVTAVIPTNGSLPQLHVQSAGIAGHACPNCVRARLYVPNVISHVDATFELSRAKAVPPTWPLKGLVLANESNVANNVSCAQ